MRDQAQGETQGQAQGKRPVGRPRKERPAEGPDGASRRGAEDSPREAPRPTAPEGETRGTDHPTVWLEVDSPPFDPTPLAPEPASEPAPLALPDVAQLADLVVMLLQAGATAAAGPDAAMLPHEQEAIQAALERMVRRLPAGAIGAAGQFADPLALVIALGSWGLRVWGVRQARHLVGVAQLQRDASASVRAQSAPTPPSTAAAPPSPASDYTGPIIDSLTATSVGPSIGGP